jgi:hypothetical protein
MVMQNPMWRVFRRCVSQITQPDASASNPRKHCEKRDPSLTGLLIQSPLSLPQGPAGFCTTENPLYLAGAKAVKPPTRGRGRLNQHAVTQRVVIVVHPHL